MTSLMKLHIWYLPVSVLFAVVVVATAAAALGRIYQLTMCTHVMCVFTSLAGVCSMFGTDRTQSASGLLGK